MLTKSFCFVKKEVGGHLFFIQNVVNDIREHSLLGEVSMYDWSPVLQIMIQLLHYNIFSFFGQIHDLFNWRQSYSDTFHL